MALTDPSDWPGSMPDLRTIDNLLRCSICFEYLNVAMIIPSCSHNYCSLCIRRFLKFKQQCPSCNTQVNTSELCNNRTLDELVKTFVAVRPHILKMCKQATPTQDGSPSADDGRREGMQRASYTKIKKVASTKQSPKESSRFNEVQSALATSGDAGSLPDPWDDFQISKKSRTSPKEPQNLLLNRGGSRNKSSTLTAGGKTGELSVSDDDVIGIDMEQPVLSACNSLVPGPATPSGSHALAPPRRIQTTPSQATPSGSQATPIRSHSLPTDSQATPGRTEDTPSGGPATPGGSVTTPGGSRDKAECPVCRVPVPTKYINTHLDACLKRSEQTQTNKRVSKRKRIAALVWTLVPDKELKKRLKEYNLSTKGKRHELVKRLDEFILMYNAQCDAANPKSAEEIAKELEKMEQLKTQPQQRKEAQVHKLRIEKGDSDAQIEQSKQQYLSAHKDQFSEMIAKTRQRMMAAKKEKEKSRRKEESPSDRTDSSLDSSQASTSSQLPTSSQEDGTKKHPPMDKDSAILQIEEVVILKEDDLEATVVAEREDIQEASSSESDSGRDGDLDRTSNLVVRGSGEERTQFQGNESQDNEMNGSGSLLQPNTGSEELEVRQDPVHVSDSSSKPAPTRIPEESEATISPLSSKSAQGLFEERCRTEDIQDSGCRVLVPSSPSVTSKHEHEDNQSQHIQDNAAVQSSVDGDLTPDLQDPLCIPESPLSVIPKTRLRKRKNQECASNTSDSGSSFGDGDVILRRSKRERKTVK